MSDGFSIDTHELDEFARALALVPVKVIPALVPVAKKAGVGVKKVMKDDASGHRHLPGLAASVGFDVEVDATSVEVEVGFAKRGQGNLANLAAYGSVNNAPVMDITRGLSQEGPRFAEWVLKVGAEALR